MDVDRLAQVGVTYFATLGTDAVLKVRELPDGLGVCVWRPIRGGGKIFVARDESVLFVGSAADFDSGLAAFRQGRRTPAEQFQRTPDSDSAGDTR
ncbi:hypothetical protein ACWD01_04090 [Streptomyces sp. NPDC002835]|jgi:hypothetical protein